jgi:hypothetical protein
MAQHGGSRPGAGRKKGQVSEAKRIIAEMAREHAVAALEVLEQTPFWIAATASPFKAWNLPVRTADQ